MAERIVIKIGGAAGIQPDGILREVAGLVRDGIRVVLVHGGSHETTTLGERLGTPARFVVSPSGHTSRRTDRATLELMMMACAGRVNKGIVESLRRLGVDAIGLCGIDGGLWRGGRKDAIRSVEDGRTVLVRDDLSGTVDVVNARLLETLLAEGLTPVLAPPGTTDDGVAINVDADRAAARTARAIGAGELLLLSNVPGVLGDVGDPGSIYWRVDDASIVAVRRASRGRMKNKVLAAEEALAGGVRRVIIASAQGATPVASARSGQGTVFGGVTA